MWDDPKRISVYSKGDSYKHINRATLEGLPSGETTTYIVYARWISVTLNATDWNLAVFAHDLLQQVLPLICERLVQCSDPSFVDGLI